MNRFLPAILGVDAGARGGDRDERSAAAAAAARTTGCRASSSCFRDLLALPLLVRRPRAGPRDGAPCSPRRAVVLAAALASRRLDAAAVAGGCSPPGVGASSPGRSRHNVARFADARAIRRVPREEGSAWTHERPSIAIVGVGYWGKNLLRTFGRLPGARVTDALRSRSGAARGGARRPPRPALHGSDFAALLARADVDAIVVATPPSRHHAMALAALRAGKHVWVEKPLALDRGGRPRAGRRRRGRAPRALRRRDLPLRPAGARDEAHHRRRRSGRRLASLVRAPRHGPHPPRLERVVELGAARSLDPLPPGAAAGDGRSALHQHTYLQPGIADMAVCDLELEGGVSAHVYLSWLHPEKTATVTVVGRERMLGVRGTLREARHHALRLHARPDAAARSDARRGAHRPDLGVRRPVARGARRRRAARARRRRTSSSASVTGVEPLTSGARSLRVVEVLEAADRAATRGGVA